MQKMLFRLVGAVGHHALFGEGSLAIRVDAEMAFEGVDADSGAAPLIIVIPLELGLHGLGHAPTVGETELGEHGAGGREAEILDEILSQEPHGHRVKQERALPGKAERASLRIQLQKLPVIQIFDAHGQPLSVGLKGRVSHPD